MANNKPSTKRKKIRETAYVPKTYVNPSKQSGSDSRTLQTTKMKKADTGGFKILNSRGISSASVPNVSMNDPRSTEEILESWYDASDSYGWDEAYVKSFVDKDIKPPSEDPDMTTESGKAGVKGVSLRVFARFTQQTLITPSRTPSWQHGPKTLTNSSV